MKILLCMYNYTFTVGGGAIRQDIEYGNQQIKPKLPENNSSPDKKLILE